MKEFGQIPARGFPHDGPQKGLGSIALMIVIGPGSGPAVQMACFANVKWSGSMVVVVGMVVVVVVVAIVIILW